MKLSVVIPAHNEEKYIGQTLKTFFRQTWRDFEIVVCLNLCNDNTEAVVRGLARETNIPIKIVKEDRKGVSFARQTGTMVASGEIIASADADSNYPNDWLEKMENIFKKTPKIIGAYGPVYLYDGSFFLKTFANIFYLPFIYFSKLFGFDNPAGMNFAFKKEVFNKTGGYDLALKSAEDVVLAKKLKKYGKIKIAPGLKVFSSSRRFRLGFWQFLAHHTKNYFRVFIFKKSPRDFKDVR